MMRLDDFLVAVARHLDQIAGEPVASRILTDADRARLASSLVTSGQVRFILFLHLGQLAGMTQAWTALSHDQNTATISARGVARIIARTAERMHVRLPDSYCLSCTLSPMHCPEIWMECLHIFHSLVVRCVAFVVTQQPERKSVIQEACGVVPVARSRSPN